MGMKQTPKNYDAKDWTPQIRHVELFTVRTYSTGDSSPQGVVDRIRSMGIDPWECTFEIGHGYDNDLVICVQGPRAETAEEVVERINGALQLEFDREAQELKEFERLKAKFGGNSA